MSQLMPGQGGAAVRLYRQGLGDCFVIALATNDDTKPFYLVVDSGVLLGTTNQDEVMKEVARDVKIATGGHIHRLIVTHEHWDHVSGFIQAFSEWQALEVDEVWFAWTEDPDDTLAKELRNKHANRKQAVAAGAELLLDSAKRKRLEAVLAFNGPSASFGIRGTTGQALAAVRQLSSNVVYRHPGERIPLPTGNLFVLGPPRNVRQLHNLDSDDALYQREPSLKLDAFLAGMDANLGISLRASTGQLLGDEDNLFQRAIPFDIQYRNSLADGESHPFLSEHYGFGEDDQGESAAWRRIGDAWLDGVEALALQMDSYTNNTSFAFAIEWQRQGETHPSVLLFPGDAQVGNWLSWYEHTWDISGRSVTVEDLLQRTVFYKVGHHGSHNATLREKGLEKMLHPDLIAYIPVDEDMARNKKKWAMPLKDLEKRLNEKTSGAVFRADRTINTTLSNVAPVRLKALNNSVVEGKNYIDITF